MKMVLKVLFCCVTFLCLLHVNNGEEQTEIVMVHALFRHGERTTENSYPTDPYINYTYYPVGIGQLTNNGKMQEYKLGQYLRKKYGDMLGDIYTDDIMEVRATGVTRTRKSALLVLAGLWPPKGDQIWNPELPWQPIPVDYERLENDDLLNVDKCKRRTQLLNEQEKIQEVQEKFIKPFQNLTAYLSEKSGLKINNPLEVGWLWLILKTEESWNLTLPEWTKSVYPSELIYNASSLSYSYLNYHLENRIINSGYLIKKMLSDTRNKMDGTFGKNEKKIMLYSGHESTVGVFLDIIGVKKPFIPDYASCLVLEVHKFVSTGKYAIRMVYKPKAEWDNVTHLYKLDGCDEFCPVDKFEALLQKYIPTKPYKEACQPIAFA